jgi:hypothetical protein
MVHHIFPRNKQYTCTWMAIISYHIIKSSIVVSKYTWMAIIQSSIIVSSSLSLRTVGLTAYCLLHAPCPALPCPIVNYVHVQFTLIDSSSLPIATHRYPLPATRYPLPATDPHTYSPPPPSSSSPSCMQPRVAMCAATVTVTATATATATATGTVTASPQASLTHSHMAHMRWVPYPTLPYPAQARPMTRP